MDFSLLGAEDNAAVETRLKAQQARDARNAYVTEGVGLLGAIAGAVIGAKSSRRHPVVGGIVGFLGGSLLAGIGTAVVLTKKEA